MTREITDGAEMGDVLLWQGAGELTASTAQKRSGVYSYLWSYVNGNFYNPYIILGSSSEKFIRIAWYTGVNLVNRSISALRYNGTILGRVVQNNRKLHIIVGSGTTPVVSTVSEYANSLWHLLEWHLKLDDSSGISEIKVDGLAAASYSGDTKPGSETNINEMSVVGDGRSDQTYFDDIAVNDTNGSVDNSWCGDGHIERLVPSGNSPDGGWTDDFVGSDSNSTDNYALVDEVPPSSSDYVQSENVGDQDRYALSDWTGTGKRIRRVYAEARALDVSSTGSKLKIGLRLSNADYLSSAIALSGVYTRIVGNEHLTNPATSSAWTESDLNAAQSLMEVSD